MHWIIIPITLLLLYFFTPAVREVTDLEKISSAGVTYYQEKKYEEALENFLKVIDASPRIPSEKEELLITALYNTGCCYFRLEEPDYESAIKHFKKLREEFPDSSKSDNALRYLGSAYFKIEDYDSALKLYQEARDKAKAAENVEAEIDLTLQISQCYTKKEDYEKALEILDKLKSEHPSQLLKQNCDYLKLLVYIKSEQTSKVIGLAEDITKEKTNPWINEVYFRTADFLFQEEEYTKAIDSYRKVKSKDGVVEQIKSLVKEVEERREYEGVVSYKSWEKSTLDYLLNRQIGVGVEVQPDLAPPALYRIGKCYFALDDYKTARETYSEIIEQYSDEEELIKRIGLEMALCYLKEGNMHLFEEWISKIESEELKLVLLQELYKDEKNALIISKKDFFSFEEEEYKSSGLYFLASAYYKTEDFSTALELFGELVEKYPESEQVNPAKFRMGQCYLKLKEYKESLPIWEELLETYLEREPEIIYMLASTHSHLKNYSKVIDYANLFLEKCPEHELVPEILNTKGVALMEQKKYPEALEVFNRLIQTYPEHELVPYAYANIGMVYYRQKKYAQMAEIFLKLEKDYPEEDDIQSQAKYWLGWNHQHNNRFEAAIEKLREVTNLYPESGWAKEAQAGVARCYAKLGKYERAREEYLIAIDKWREDKDYLLRTLDEFTMTFRKEWEFAKAIKIYKQLIEKYSAEAVTIDYLSFKLAGVYYYNGDDQKSAALYKKVLPVLPKEIFSPQDWYMIGEVFFKTGDYYGALDNYSVFLSSPPAEAEAFIGEAVKGIGLCWLKLKDPSVEKKLKEMLNRYPDTKELPEVNLVSGEMNRLRGRYNRAIPFYERTMGRLAEDELTAQVLLGLGQCYQKVGRYEDAVVCYKRVELIYGYLAEFADKAKVGFEECNRHLEAKKAVTAVAK